MSIVTLIVVLVVIGVILYFINVYIPMDPTIKKILNAAVIIILILWLLQAFGLLGPLESVRLR